MKFYRWLFPLGTLSYLFWYSDLWFFFFPLIHSSLAKLIMTSVRRKVSTSLGHRCRFQVLGPATALPVGRPTLCPLGLSVRNPSDKNIPYSCSSVSSSAWILCEDSDQFGSSWQEPLSVRHALLPSLPSHSVATDRTEIKKETDDVFLCSGSASSEGRL